MTDEFENALAWFRSAPGEWIESGRKNLAAGAEWIWEVLQGDFNDRASTAQVVTGTVISMIPFVDQLCDVRDLVANCKSIKQQPDNSWPWVSLVLKPVQDYLIQLARRLEIDADMAHRAYLNTANPHAFKKLKEAEEAAAFAKAKPGWVDDTGIMVNPRLHIAPPAKPGWPSTRDYHTFHTMNPVTIPPGTKLYRIVDPTSKDNSICWMTETEFKKLKSKDDWRRRFAVWANWNSNGEFVTYTVPPGSGLNVWEGVTASQAMKNTDYVLEGGAIQLVVDPTHLEKLQISPRKKTGWGYDELGTTNDLIGVPVQKNNWVI